MNLWKLMPDKLFGLLKCEFKLPNQTKPKRTYCKIRFHAQYENTKAIIFRNNWCLIPEGTKPPYYFYFNNPVPIASKIEIIGK